MPDLPLPGGALFALGFVALVAFLSIYAIVYYAKRRKQLDELLPSHGLNVLPDPPAEELVPELLFHPNGFPMADGEMTSRLQDSELFRRVPAAWKGRLGAHDVVVMDVSISRLMPRGGANTDRDKKVNHTVIRHDPGPGPRPPDFVIEERVLLKSQIRGERAVNGPAQIGGHYFLFSAAPDEELAPWINTDLRSQLGQHRLWEIAAHQGILYLTRGTSVISTRQIQSFLQEGEALLTALLAARDAAALR